MSIWKRLAKSFMIEKQVTVYIDRPDDWVEEHYKAIQARKVQSNILEFINKKPSNAVASHWPKPSVGPVTQQDMYNAYTKQKGAKE